MKRAQLIRLAGTTTALILVTVVGSASPAAASGVVVVTPGHSIQDAIDTALAGTTIHVRAGTYAENLEIVTDGITLRGDGPGNTVLVPPAHPLQRFCTPDPNDPIVAGICATGTVDFETAQVTRFLQGTRITGFSVRDFPGVGILLVGVADGLVEGNESARNGARGVLAMNSTRSRIAGNVATDNQSGGIQVDKVEFVNPGALPAAAATVVGNRVTGTKGPGIVSFDAEQSRITGNRVSGNCGGIVLINLAGTASDWTISANLVTQNNLACPAKGGPPLSGLGIGVLGVTHVRIIGNVVWGNQPAGPSDPSGGIAVQTTAPFGGADPTDVRVTSNVVRNNEPSDLFWDGTGSAVTFAANVCQTSNPATLCP